MSYFDSREGMEQMSRESEKKHVEALLHGPGKVPTIQVSGDDFYAIEKALQGYGGYLRSGENFRRNNNGLFFVCKRCKQNSHIICSKHEVGAPSPMGWHLKT